MAWILVLVVDDDWSYRNMLRLILEGRGHVVLEAADGGEGLALYEQHNPDVVITDMIMPGIEGGEVIAEIRKRGDGSESSRSPAPACFTTSILSRRQRGSAPTPSCASSIRWRGY